MGLFDKRPPCAICGGKVKGLLPWKIEGNYICDDCHGVIDAQNGNDFTMEQFLKYRDFREQNQALREQFRVDEIVEFGFLSEKFVFDYEHSLFCMDKNLNKTIFHGSELKSFMISEDGAPLLEGSAKGFIYHESRVPQRIDELLPQVNQMLIQLVTDGRLKEHLLGKLQVRLQTEENNPAAIDKTDVIDIRGTADNG